MSTSGRSRTGAGPGRATAPPRPAAPRPRGRPPRPATRAGAARARRRPPPPATRTGTSAASSASSVPEPVRGQRRPRRPTRASAPRPSAASSAAEQGGGQERDRDQDGRARGAPSPPAGALPPRPAPPSSRARDRPGCRPRTPTGTAGRRRGRAERELADVQAPRVLPPAVDLAPGVEQERSPPAPARSGPGGGASAERRPSTATGSRRRAPSSVQRNIVSGLPRRPSRSQRSRKPCAKGSSPRRGSRTGATGARGARRRRGVPPPRGRRGRAGPASLGIGDDTTRPEGPRPALGTVANPVIALAFRRNRELPAATIETRSGARTPRELFRLYEEVFGRTLTESSRRRWRGSTWTTPPRGPAARDLGGARRGRGSSANTPRCRCASAGAGARCARPGAWTSSCTPARARHGRRRAAVHDLERPRRGRPRPRPHALVLRAVPEAALHGRGPGALLLTRCSTPARWRDAGSGPRGRAGRSAPRRSAGGCATRERPLADPSLAVAPLARLRPREYDALWERAGASLRDVRAARRAYLDWKYGRVPDTGRYDMDEAARADGVLAGLRGEPPRGLPRAAPRAGSWTCFAARDDDAARDALLAAVLARFRARGRGARAGLRA